jgi:signal peptidase complex subunit 3
MARFNLTHLILDFSTLFCWNVKQLFVYLVVKYENQEFPRNEIVIWDRIITQQDRPIIDEDNLSAEYSVADIKEHLGYYFMPFIYLPLYSLL